MKWDGLGGRLEVATGLELAIDSVAGWRVRMIPKLAAVGIGIDVNTAGMRKSTCLKTYAPEWFVQECLARNIACVFGSDAHHPNDIGSGWDWCAATVAEKE